MTLRMRLQRSARGSEWTRVYSHSRAVFRHPLADLCAPLRVQLHEDGLDVVIRRAFGDAITRGDLSVGQPRGYKLANVCLAWWEGGVPRFGCLSLADKFCELPRRVLEDAALTDRAIALESGGRGTRCCHQRERGRRSVEERPPVHTSDASDRLRSGVYLPESARAMANAATMRR